MSINLVEATRNVELKKEVPCFHCNGYYDDTLKGQYICDTCHDFIYNISESCFCARRRLFIEARNNDDDSGNDEPSEGQPPGVEKRSPISSVAISGDAVSTGTNSEERLSHGPEESGSFIGNNDSQNFCDLMNHLPCEVLLIIFSYVDGASLWCASRVCKRWNNIILANTSSDKWETAVKTHFPLYKPLWDTKNWYDILSRLLNQTTCLRCLLSTELQIPKDDKRGVHHLSGVWIGRRLHSEDTTRINDRAEGMDVIPMDSKRYHWFGYICGPLDSPYEGGIFFLYIYLPPCYPMGPPKIRFMTKVFHPNISRHGDVGVDFLRINWSISFTMMRSLLAIQSLLTDPNCEECMEPDVGKLYMTDRKEYNRIAREWTWKYAMADVILTTPPPRKGTLSDLGDIQK